MFKDSVSYFGCLIGYHWIVYKGDLVINGDKRTFKAAAEVVKKDYGNDRSLLFKFDDSKNYQELYINDTEEQEQGITFWDRLGSLIGIGLDPDENKNGADISEINYNVFTNSAKIEFHGCNTASEPKLKEKIELEKKNTN